ncbi:MAG: discoidin domain-containing protein, partial [Saprospiraceae bacterium]
SGPATISNNTITLDGTEGTVVVRASQAGNTQFNPAQDVDQSFEVTEPQVGACTTTSNLALGKPASQSGIQLGAEASRVVDGNTNGNFWGGEQSVSLTNWTPNAWWEVDLQVPATIETIDLWNRTDCCDGLFANYYVFVSDVPFISQNINTTLNQSGVSSYLQSGSAGYPTTVNISRTGRYVRVQLVGTAYLAIAEVEVIGCVDTGGGPIDQTITFDPLDDKFTTDPAFDLTATATSGLPVSYSIVSGPATVSNNTITLDGTEGIVVVRASQAGNTNFNPAPNVDQSFVVTTPPPALCTNATNIGIGKIATQSGTQLGADADRAIDGDTDGNFWNGQSVTLTDWVGNAWWEIDLGEIHNIDDIKLWNRTDCCSEKFADFYVFVSDIPFTSQGLDATLNQSGVDNYYVEGEAGLPTELSIVRTGQYIRIQLVGTSYLAIAEVEIMGCTTSNLIDSSAEFINETPTASQSSFRKENLQAKVFPNPAEDIITVDFQTPTDNNLQVFVMDTKGSELLRREFYTYAGSHSFTIDISQYPTGTYVVYLQHGEFRKVIQFVKL